jgi:hypothetical protein
MAFATFSYKRPAKVQVLIALGLVALAVFITVCGNHAMVLLDSSANQHDLGLLSVRAGPRLPPGGIRHPDDGNHLPRLLRYGTGLEAEAEPTESRRMRPVHAGDVQTGGDWSVPHP